MRYYSVTGRRGTMNRKSLSGLAFALACAAAPLQADPQFVAVDGPDGIALGTGVAGINAAGSVAAYYWDRHSHFTGFVRTPTGDFNTYEVSLSTLLSGIDAAGDVAGEYWDSNGAVPAHGFVASADGTVTKFDAPGAGGSTGTRIAQMNAGGTVAGYYSDAGDVFHGYLRKLDGTMRMFDAPGAGGGAHQGTTSKAINDRNAICGSVIDANGVRHGFIRARNGAFTIFDAPGAGTASGQGTNCGAIAADGRTLGYFVDGGGGVHSFARAVDGTITAIDVPGATRTDAGVFAGKKLGVFGDFFDANNAYHGFLLRPSGAIKRIDAPGAGGGSFQGTDISAFDKNGVIVGDYVDSAGVSHGYIRLP
jgi:hypothetical protein